MKNLKVTAIILAAALSAGALIACSSNKETEESAQAVESTTSESETTESIILETENAESSESVEDEDALTEAVLQYITVARVEEIKEDGTLELVMFELPEESEEGIVDQEAEATEESNVNQEAEATADTTEETAVMSETVANDTVEEEQQGKEETVIFDFASLDLSVFVETEWNESYQADENAVIKLVEDGALTEAVLSDIQEGDMLVFFMGEDEVSNIIIYRAIVKEEVASE